MPTFEKGGKKYFHANPQQGKSLYGDSEGESRERAGKGPGKEKTDLHSESGPQEHESDKIANYDGHDHEGHLLAHHVELHHEGHPGGEPPAHEGTTHHTITHPHPSHGSEPTVTNHDSPEEAHAHMSGAMHETCPVCGHSMGEEQQQDVEQDNVGNEGAEGY